MLRFEKADFECTLTAPAPDSLDFPLDVFVANSGRVNPSWDDACIARERMVFF